MAENPLGALKDSLAYLFELQETKNGQYINPLVQNLKNALDRYASDPSASLHDLTLALKRALPVIDNYADTHTVKERMDALAGTKGETISWYTRSRPSYSPNFQFASENRKTEGDFISCLSLRCGQDFANLAAEEQVQILTEQSESSFKAKLGVYLRSNPNFLVNLALQSPQACMKILNSPLRSHLEEDQIEKAMDHHGLVREEKKFTC